MREAHVAYVFPPFLVMQWSPYPEVRILTNENGRFMIKLNDIANHGHGDGIPLSLPQCGDLLFFSHAFYFQ